MPGDYVHNSGGKVKPNMKGVSMVSSKIDKLKGGGAFVKGHSEDVLGVVYWRAA